MTEELQRDDELDASDDFVIDEGPGAAVPSLESLFDPAAAEPRATEPAAGEPPAAAPAPDADDLLFAAPDEPAAAPSEQFAARAPFEADAPSSWSGELLELDDVAADAPHAFADAAQRGASSDVGMPDEFALEASQEFDGEEEDLASLGEPLSPAALEALGTTGQDEAADLVVLDEGNGEWQSASAEAEAGTENGDVGAEPLAADGETEEATEFAAADAFAAEGGSDAALELDEAVADGDVAAAGLSMPLNASADGASEPTEAGWEPLAGAGFDELADVQEVASASGDGAAGAAPEHEREPEFAAAAAAELAATLAVATPPPELRVLAGQTRQRRWGGWTAAAAALLLACGIGVAAVVEPQWFGLGETTSAQLVAEVPRPVLANGIGVPPLPEPRSLAVVEPAQPQPVEPDRSQPAGAGAVAAANPVDVVAPGSAPVAAPLPPVAPPVAVAGPAVPEPPAPSAVPAEPMPPTAVPVPEPTAVAGTGPVVAPATEPEASPSQTTGTTATPTPGLQWPVAVTTAAPAERNGTVVRFDESVVVADAEPVVVATPVDGVAPGTRAFAQLRNGNYFIGNIKSSSQEAVTLVYGKGEVTLPRAELSHLTALGSQDYEDLQKATSGFVRLTNRNRLVGSIMAGITDDYVVLESRSNRVLLPRSVVGEIVEGEGQSSVQVGTTDEEELWLRRQAERQLRDSARPAAPAPAPRATGR
ncbi:MAG: hypothetical protein JNK49_09285 [Planctomycetes bacterium]|nr:hypothetical protein [Planctomycetota bacterium]